MNYTLLKGLKNLNRCQPDAVWAKNNKQALLFYFNNNFSSVNSQSSQPSLKSFGMASSFLLRLRPVVAIFVILGIVLLSGVGTIYAAQNSVPGQSLYAVKMFAEKVRLAMTPDLAKRNVLRAELLNNRVTEAQVLARRVYERGDSQASKDLIAAVHIIKSDIKVLQKGISDQARTASQSDVNDNTDNSASAPVATADQGSLPIQDGKKAADMILSPDVQKSLLETQELLVKNDLTSALIKTVEVNIKLNLISNVTSTAPIIPDNTSINNTTTLTDPTLKKPADSATKDFVAPIIQENSVNTGLIQEK